MVSENFGKRIKEEDDDLEFLKNTPRRLSEIWKLYRETNTVVVIGSNGIVRFNRLGSAIWIMLDGENNIKSIIEELAKAYPSQKRSHIEGDVRAFLNDLIANRLALLEWDPLYKYSSPKI